MVHIRIILNINVHVHAAACGYPSNFRACAIPIPFIAPNQDYEQKNAEKVNVMSKNAAKRNIMSFKLLGDGYHCGIPHVLLLFPWVGI